MQNPLDAVRRCGNPERRSPDIDAVPLLAPIRRPSIVRGKPPLRIIGRRGNHPHLMPASDKPRSHFPRVLADSRGLGGEVSAADQDLHFFEFYWQSETMFRTGLRKALLSVPLRIGRSALSRQM